MKYKIIATVVIIAVALLVLALKGCSNSQPATDENNNVNTEVQQ